MKCTICASYIEDCVKRNLRVDDILYSEIHPHRLTRILPEIIYVFQRYFETVSEYHMSVTGLIVNVDLQSAVDASNIEKCRIIWKSITRWCKAVPNEFGIIEELFKDHYICKKDVADQLIGYWLNQIHFIHEIHKEHETGFNSKKDHI